MKRVPVARIQDLVGLVHTLFPPSLAEDWDNVGLQVGEATAELKKVLVCLDPSEKALDAAVAAGAQAIVAHHPLIFKPLRNLTSSNETGRVLLRAVRENLAVVSAHTNLDRAAGGLNDWLATLLGLENSRPLLQEEEGEMVKLVVFIPAGYESGVADALFAAGAGHIGNYSCCSFRLSGTGTFKAEEGTSPYIGKQGQIEQVRETRMETILPKDLSQRVVQAMCKAHPYEEVAYDLIPLVNRREGIGLGRIGRLSATISLNEYAVRIKEVLQTQFLRLAGDLDRQVTKVAVCGGSGAFLLAESARQGADLLVTGDVKYHEARNAEALGVAVIDAGHFATERLMVRFLAKILHREAEKKGLLLEIIEMEGEEDPFKTI
jgi:dinuclear metal center YbgI/SA1388 family protein